MSTDNKETINIAVSNEVNTQYDRILNRLSKYLITQQNNTKSIALLSNIEFSFTNDEINKYQACAIYDELDFEDRKPSHIINYELSRSNSYAKTIIHELSHLIIDDYNVCLKNKSGAHCLEFAIVTYCIEIKLYHQNDRKRCFFNSYDVHEDVCYPVLVLNPAKLDTLLRLIEWQTFDDLVEQACKLAQKIRKKLVL